MVAAVWSVFLRGAVLENHEEIPARTSTIRDCVDPRLSAALPFMTTIDQSSAVNKSGHSKMIELTTERTLCATQNSAFRATEKMVAATMIWKECVERGF